MSFNGSVEDEVSQLMRTKGISRVQATKELYELSKQRKKEKSGQNSSAHINEIVQMDKTNIVKQQIDELARQKERDAALLAERSANNKSPVLETIQNEPQNFVKQHIERYASKMDLTSPSGPTTATLSPYVASDIDFLDDRPILKTDIAGEGETIERFSPASSDGVARAMPSFRVSSIRMQIDSKKLAAANNPHARTGQIDTKDSPKYQMIEEENVNDDNTQRQMSMTEEVKSGKDSTDGLSIKLGAGQQSSPMAANGSPSMISPGGRRLSASTLDLRPLSRLHPTKFKRGKSGSMNSMTGQEESGDYDEDYVSGASSDEEDVVVIATGTLSKSTQGVSLNGQSLSAKLGISSMKQISSEAGADEVKLAEKSTESSVTKPQVTQVDVRNNIISGANKEIQAVVQIESKEGGDAGKGPEVVARNTGTGAEDSTKAARVSASEKLSPTSFAPAPPTVSAVQSTLSPTVSKEIHAAELNTQSTVPQRPAIVSKPMNLVPDLPIEEKIALISAGKYLAGANSPASGGGSSSAETTVPLPSTVSPVRQSEMESVVNMKVGGKNLTVRSSFYKAVPDIRGGSGSASIVKPPENEPMSPSINNNTTPKPSPVIAPVSKMQPPPFHNSAKHDALPPPPPPPPPPPSYETVTATTAIAATSAATITATAATSTTTTNKTISSISTMKPPPPPPPPTMSTISSQKESCVGMSSSVEESNEESNVVASLSMKYAKRERMAVNPSVEKFKNLPPVDPAVVLELESKRRDEGTNSSVGGGSVNSGGGSTLSKKGSFGNLNQASASLKINTTEATLGGMEAPSTFGSSGSMSVRSNTVGAMNSVGRVTAGSSVESISAPNSAGVSNDLVEELIAQGYSRINAIKLAKEIELDRRGERFAHAAPPTFSGGGGNGSSKRTPSVVSVGSAHSRNRERSFNDDFDDLGSVVSNISDKVSVLSENDSLLMNLLLSQQKKQFGTNMFESLTHADEPIIEDYMSRGCSLDQAVLKVFEAKFGVVESALPKSLNSSLSKSNYPHGGVYMQGGVRGVVDENDEILVDSLHAEIELLMLSGGYTRDVAVKMLLNRVAKEKATRQHKPTMMYNEAEYRTVKGLHRSSTMGGMAMTANRPGGGGGGGIGYNSMPGIQEYENNGHVQHALHPSKSMYAMGVNSSAMSATSYQSNSKVSYDLPDFPMQYAPSYTAGASGDSWQQNNKRRPSGSSINSGVASVQSYGKFSLATNSVTSRTSDDQDYLPALLAQQESEYGVNMFSYLSPDDPEVLRLMSELGYSKIDAMTAVFQQFPPQRKVGGVNKRIGQANGGGSGIGMLSDDHSVYSSTSKAAVKPVLPPTSPRRTDISKQYQPNVTSDPDYDENAALERAMKLSMEEHKNVPGAVSVPGLSKVDGAPRDIGRGMFNVGDVRSLVSMGFTARQAEDALARFNFDVHRAADFLLGGR